MNSIRDVKSRGKKGTEIEYHLTEVIERVEVADVISLQKGLDDDLLGMFFVCNHPEVPVETLVPLTLRTLCGFETAELARAYLLSEDALKKRLVRGRAQLREFAPKIELPNITEMKVRLDSVLATIYLEQVPGIFSFSLLISVIPQIVGQSYVAFGSASLFDNSFHVAHFLKVISYVVPLTGICLHYVYNLKRERQVVEQVIQSQKLAFLGQLSSGAAHEINNPLTVVRGLNEVLEHNARSGR